MFKCRLDIPLVRENIGAARIFCGRIVEGYMGMERNIKFKERGNVNRSLDIRVYYGKADRKKV
jgi:hypothetical protein